MAESIMSSNRLFVLLAEPSATTNEERCLQVSNIDQSTFDIVMVISATKACAP